MNGKWLTLAAIACGLFVAGAALGLTMNEKVVVADRLIHPVRVGAGGFTAEARVARINERLNQIIATESLAPSNIRLRRIGGDPAIFVGNSIVTTVTEADARANNTTRDGLARVWLLAYRSILPQARPNSGHG